MTPSAMNISSVEACVEEVIKVVGKQIVLGVPLGLGKPVQFINALYRKAKDNPDIQLRIITALSLEKPKPSSDIEARFLNPFVERLFGDYPELEYMQALRADSLPSNITVSEFYFKAGAMKQVPHAQANYISTNYTFVARDLIDNGVNVLAQMVAEKRIDGNSSISLSCNTDVTLDLMPLLEQERKRGRRIAMVAQVHDDLPFMLNDAVVEPRVFDFIIRNPAYNTRLFAPPNMSVPAQDFLAGLHASTLIKDGGTLQIGIGSLGDAIVYAAKLRHQHNDFYRAITHEVGLSQSLVERDGGLAPFEQGLYGASEMFVNGFRHLMDADIVKRNVYNDLALQTLLNDGDITEKVAPHTLQKLLERGAINRHLSVADLAYLQRFGILQDGIEHLDDRLRIGDIDVRNDLLDAEAYKLLCHHGLGTQLQGGICMHGGFFLGPQDFYDYLRTMPDDQAQRICMSSVGLINQLAHNSPLLSAQRRHARFVNTGMMVTLGGSVVSDGLENGRVVSGVGGQYNFVAMAHALPDARSVLCIRAVRGSGKEVKSNIVPYYGHITIPRHLRDIVVTEYGVACLRGKTDEEVVIELIRIADSRFQDDLLNFAKENGKVRPDYVLPNAYRDNTPAKVEGFINEWRKQGYFPPFPLGTDFTDEEIAIGKSLKDIKALMNNPRKLIRAIVKAYTQDIDETEATHYLERMQLAHPNTAKEHLIQHLLLLELEEHGYLRAM